MKSFLGCLPGSHPEKMTIHIIQYMTLQEINLSVGMKTKAFKYFIIQVLCVSESQIQLDKCRIIYLFGSFLVLIKVFISHLNLLCTLSDLTEQKRRICEVYGLSNVICYSYLSELRGVYATH